MFSKKTTIIYVTIVFFSSILVFTSINKEVNLNSNQISVQVDEQFPKVSYQNINELWIDNGIYACGNGTWADIEAANSWCVDVNGDGSLYLIENITLANPDGIGSSCIIANSTVDFIIQNCTFTNSDAVYGDAGIKLLNTSNGNIYSCNISNNNGKGLMLYENCANITIKNNTINRNEEGIYIRWNNYPNNSAINNTITDCIDNGIAMFEDGSTAENNTIEGGTACIAASSGDKIVIRNNTLSGSQYGIHVFDSATNLTISGNTMTDVGIYYEGYSDDGYKTMKVYSNNTVNGNTIYIYKDKIGLDPADFISAGNPGQILLFNCSYSKITNFNISHTSVGIQLLHYSKHNNISHNKFKDNYIGIKLYDYCDNNTIMNNTAINTNYGIQLEFYNDNNTLIENNITGTKSGPGIQLQHFNNDNIITKNHIVSNTFSGIMVWNSDYNNITHNKVNENSIGTYLYQDASNNMVYNNTCNDNTDGIKLFNGCNDNLILENNCSDTLDGNLQARGIYLTSSCLRNDIINNSVFENDERGIFIESDSMRNNISYNDVRFGNDMGIYLGGDCDNTTIYKNNVSENLNDGIHITSICNKNSILENKIINNHDCGIYIYDGDDNYIYKNEIINNGHSGINQGAIYLESAVWTNITHNEILLNEYGIYFVNADLNNITLNNIKNNIYGIFMTSYSDNNMINSNNFTDNTIHAWDQSTGAGNYWNNASIGNYWDNYTGVDDDDDGIGDSPHPIPGGAGAFDNKPIWWDGINAPVITIISPSEGQVCNATVPIFNVQITGIGIDEQWFSFFNGSEWTENASWTGVEVDQALWNTAGNGSIIVRFWANNSNGISLKEINLSKDIFAPDLKITNPANYSLRKISERDFNFTVQEGNLDTMWYSIEGVGHYEFTQNGTFDQTAWETAWDATSNGDTFLIRFFANDTAGNTKFVDLLITVDKSDEKEDENGDDNEDEVEPISISMGVYVVFATILSIISLVLILKPKIYNKR